MTKIVFFDTDCLSSFLWTKTERLLIHCFKNNMIAPTQVYDEISKVPHLRQRVDDMVRDGNLIIEDILVDTSDSKLYLELTDYTKKSTLPLIGKGEAAAIVLSKKNNGILASNNLKDIKYYVDFYKLKHITTADIIHQAVNDKLVSIIEADSIWTEMVNKKRRLPFKTYTEYLNSL